MRSETGRRFMCDDDTMPRPLSRPSWAETACRCRSFPVGLKIERIMSPVVLILCLATGPALQAGPVDHGDRSSAAPAKAASATPTPKPSREPWVDAPCSAEARPEDAPDEAVARVNHQWIFLYEVDEIITEELLQVDEALADARVRELYLQINRKLLNQESKRLRVGVDDLLKREVVARTPDPDAQSVRRYYEEHEAEYGPDYEKVRGKIQARLRLEREGIRARQYADTLRQSATLTSVSNDFVQAGLPADPEKVLARVNGEFITVADIERSMKPLVAQAQGRIHTLRANALDQLVNDRLLRERAAREQVPEEELLAREIKKRMNEVMQADAHRFVARNRKRLQTDIKTPEGLRSIMYHLKDQELQRATLAFSKALRDESEIHLFLPSPESPLFEIDTIDQPALGPSDAPITIIAFLDYQCSACAWLHGHMAELMRKHNGKVRFVARDFPLKGHKNAYQAALAAEAARQQGRYWDYSGILMTNQHELDEPHLIDYARRLGLDLDRFRAAMAEGALAEKVEIDRREAMRLGIEGTPGVFLNGQRIRLKDDTSLDNAFKAALDSLHQKAS